VGNTKKADNNNPASHDRTCEKKHTQTHWGVDAIISSLKSSAVCVGMTEVMKSIITKCPICLKNNPLNRKRAPLGITKQDNTPENY